MSEIEKTVIENFEKSLGAYTVDKPEKKPKDNYINILLLRELKSAARFTTDGSEANSAVIRIQNGKECNVEATVGKLFGRKQVASDRRKAKAVQRLLISDEMIKAMDNGAWDGCTMKVTEMCQKCPECALFGSAASDEKMSITSRVMYDEAYTIRALNTVVEEYFQNAPGDDYAKKPTSGIRETDFFKEGTLFPCVITLKDVTPEEVLFFLNITDRNSRYGATGTRFGKMQNHILGIFAGHREGPSSLEVTRGIALKLAEKEPSEKNEKTVTKDQDKLEDKLRRMMARDTLSVEEVKSLAIEVYKSLSNDQRVKYSELNETEIKHILDALKEDSTVKSILIKQIGKLNDFLTV
jgi:CRISPR-associated protein Csc2